MLHPAPVAVPLGDQPVRIATLLIVGGKAERPVEIAGPLRAAVRNSFAHPRLAAAFETLGMDPDRLTARIASRWESPAHGHEAKQAWVKSDGTTTARWWVTRDQAHAGGRRDGRPAAGSGP